MKPIYLVALACASCAITSLPAEASWKLVQHAQPVDVAKSTMTVTPAEDWNRSSHRASKKGETWTLDGPGINELYFLAGLAPGETLYRDLDQKNKPLPTMGNNLQLTDIPDFFESSVRVSYDTSVFQVTNLAPVKFLGVDGVRFTYDFAVQGNPLHYKGVAQAALIKGQLYLISFTAPSIYFFGRDDPKAEAIMASAKI